MNTKYFFIATLFICIQLCFQSCAPVFSELQSARLVGRNQFELTPMFSGINATDKSKSAHLQNEAGIQAAFGVSDKIDFRCRSELIWYEGSDYSSMAAIIGLGPKISLIENKIAISLPFGTGINENFFHEWEFQPSLLWTIPAIKNYLDVTVSPKYVWTFCDDCQNLGAINLGLAFSTDFSKWAFRSEYGHLYDFGENGHVAQFSIGLSKTFGKKAMKNNH